MSGITNLGISLSDMKGDLNAISARMVEFSEIISNDETKDKLNEQIEDVKLYLEKS